MKASRGKFSEDDDEEYTPPDEEDEEEDEEDIDDHKVCRRKRSSFSAPRSNAVSSRGCARLFIICVLQAALSYCKSLFRSPEFPFKSSLVRKWLLLAKNTCQMGGGALSECYGGVCFDVDNLASYWHQPSQFYCWWKNNIERKSKFAILQRDASAAPFNMKQFLRRHFCSTVVVLATNIRQHFERNRLISTDVGTPVSVAGPQQTLPCLFHPPPHANKFHYQALQGVFPSPPVCEDSHVDDRQETLPAASVTPKFVSIFCPQAEHSQLPSPDDQRGHCCFCYCTCHGGVYWKRLSREGGGVMGNDLGGLLSPDRSAFSIFCPTPSSSACQKPVQETLSSAEREKSPSSPREPLMTDEYTMLSFFEELSQHGPMARPLSGERETSAGALEHLFDGHEEELNAFPVVSSQQKLARCRSFDSMQFSDSRSEGSSSVFEEGLFGGSSKRSCSTDTEGNKPREGSSASNLSSLSCERSFAHLGLSSPATADTFLFDDKILFETEESPSHDTHFHLRDVSEVHLL